MIAFHGEPDLKAAVLVRLREHRRLDEIIQGTYYDNGRGCHLGCLTHSNQNTHELAERLFGIEQRVGYWLEAVFEGLPQEHCADWVLNSIEAIPVGADLSKCHHHFGKWLLGPSGLLAINDTNREAIEGVRRLHERATLGAVSEQDWSAARSAALSAESAARSAARSAESAAESAALSALSAVWSAELSAESAAESALSAAWSAALSAESAAESARSAAWQKIVAKSIEIFRAAPVAIELPISEAVKSELCCRRLWCPDGELVTA